MKGETHDRNTSLSLRSRVRMPEPMPLRSRMPVLREEITPIGCVDQPSTPPLQTLLENRKQFLRFLTGRVTSPALAEDILQAAYLKALEHASTLRAGESARAWFYRILRNAVIDYHRHRAVEDRALETWAAELETEVPANDLTQDLVCKCIARVIPSLKPSYAEILNAVDLDETPLAAFAASRTITLLNATTRIHRARKALRQRLIETCGACSTHACLNCNCRA
jgi:RNA polymerase sigma factor (sigma-70 family)